MIDALIQGKLHAKAQQRTGKAGRPFVTAKVTTTAKDGNAQFVNVIAFAPDACNALLALGAPHAQAQQQTGSVGGIYTCVDAQGRRAWATVGSSNLDPLSLLLAREANVVVRDRAFASELHARLCQAMAGAGQRVQAVQLAQRPWHQRLLDRVAYALMRSALWLTGNRY